MPRSALSWPLGLALATALAAACAPAYARVESVPVTIVLGDHGFGFRDIGFRAPSVDLKVENHGKRKHALAIEGHDEAGTIRIATAPIPPGGTARISFTLPPGTYRLYSPLDHDRAHGLSAPMEYMTPSPGNSSGAEMNRVFYNY